MNPSSSHHPFSFPLQNPNPNFFFHSLPPPPQPPQVPPTSATTTSPDLSSTLSSLTHLLSLYHQTLSSFSSLCPQTILPNPSNVSLVPCPYNPHHLMPPESLFLHSLHCPSPLFQDPTSLIASLHYPKTLNLQNPDESLFRISNQDSGDAGLCFSLDGFYGEFGSNFFYKDCPGVVNFSSLGVLSRNVTLPAVLSVECADFVACSGVVTKCSDEVVLRVLPSELWAIRREIEGWIGYPVMYPYGVACAISKITLVKDSDLMRWIIVNSPRYGVVIDAYMRDHMYVLFSLCLKAIRKEATDSVGCLMGMESSRIKCPVLSQALMWVASQLSALYGEMNAKSFAIQIIKQCVLWAADQLVLAPYKSSLKMSCVKGSEVKDIKAKDHYEGNTELKAGDQVAGSVDGRVIFLFQVAASVAALHERSLLEATMKGLRSSQPLAKYQRMAEHEHVSKKAEEERTRRPNYRSIIDHDGFRRRRMSDQETNKIKTREELLAEERDYKRRRLSYRGKKVKRTALQVMRDLIDEYMEEIKQAGGIGCFEKGAGEEGMNSDLPSVLDASDVRKSNYGSPNHDWKQSHSNHTIGSSIPKDYAYDFEGHERGHGEHQRLENSTSANQGRHVRECSSRSPERNRSHSHFHERSSDKRKQDDVEMTRPKHHGGSIKSDYGNFESYSVSDSTGNSSLRNDRKSDIRDRSLIKSCDKHSTYAIPKHSFTDRYNPTESYET